MTPQLTRRHMLKGSVAFTASTSYLNGSGDKDNELVKRTRGALPSFQKIPSRLPAGFNVKVGVT